MPREPHEFPRDVQNLIAALKGLPENRSRAKDRQAQPLGASLDKILKKYHLAPEAPEHVLYARWNEIVGPAIAAYSHPVRIDPKGKLLVLTSHAVARDELRILEPVVLQRVRRMPGCEHVTGLMLRAG